MVCSAWLAIDLALSISFCSEVMPVLAACSTCTPLAMPSSRLLMSLARLSSDWAVKKLVGLSRGVSEVLCKSVSVRGLRGQRTDPMGSVR
ncbi:hypothetical protein ACVMHZ_005861 [Bradyrhizobium liaoningense]